MPDAMWATLRIFSVTSECCDGSMHGAPFWCGETLALTCADQT
jgi:hypothetical protein